MNVAKRHMRQAWFMKGEGRRTDRCQHQRTGNSIANIIMAAVLMIDDVLAAAPRLTNQGLELQDHFWMVEQFDALRIHEWQER